MSTSFDTEAVAIANPQGLRGFWRRISLRDSGLVLALLAMIIIFSLLRPNSFFSWANLQNILQSSSGLLIMAVGVTMLMIAGQLDLSIGSVLVFSSVVGGQFLVTMIGWADNGFPMAGIFIIAIVITLIVGALWGLVNGLLVTRMRLNPLIVTLGTFGAALGLAKVLANGNNILGIPLSMQREFGVKQWLSLPAIAYVAVGIAIIGALVLSRTRFGRHTYAIGSNPAASRRAGIPVDRHLVTLFVLTGLLAGLAAVIDLSRFATTSLDGHSIDNLTVISAVVIGGTSLSGGRGSMFGTVLGVFIPVVLQVGLLVLGIPPFWQTFAIGLVLIAAVAMDSAQRSAESRRFI